MALVVAGCLFGTDLIRGQVADCLRRFDHPVAGEELGRVTVGWGTWCQFGGEPRTTPEAGRRLSL
jgi:hypothetical protein